jgi:single-strand selective monofunctional uracil DNA glycosylase
VVGVGGFAARRAAEVFQGSPVRIGQILHPSPANPAANRNWKGLAGRQLQALGIWD